MAEKLIKWTAILSALVLGLGLVLQPTLINVLPRIFHYILGIVLLIISGYAIYKEV